MVQLLWIIFYKSLLDEIRSDYRPGLVADHLTRRTAIRNWIPGDRCSAPHNRRTMQLAVLPSIGCIRADQLFTKTGMRRNLQDDNCNKTSI